MWKLLRNPDHRPECTAISGRCEPRLRFVGRLLVPITFAIFLGLTNVVTAESIDLRAGGKPGDSYTDEVAISIIAVFSPSSPGEQQARFEFRNNDTFQFLVTKIGPGGNVFTKLKTSRIGRFVSMNGGTVLDFDSANPAHRQSGSTNPQAAIFLNMLDLEVTHESDATGSIVSYDVQAIDPMIGKALKPMLDQVLDSSIMIVPGGSIEVGQGWRAGRRKFQFSGIGVLEYGIIARLLRVERRSGERLAIISLESNNPVYTAGSSAPPGTFQLKSFSFDGQVRFSLDRGRIIEQSSTGKMSARIQEQGGRENGMDIEFKLLDKEVSGSRSAALHKAPSEQGRPSAGFACDPYGSFCSSLICRPNSYCRDAVEGDAKAQAVVGFWHEIGSNDAAKDDEAAVHWYRKSAEQGNAVGQLGLGHMYSRGRGGLDKDLATAVRWLRKAAAQGDDEAKIRLDNLGCYWPSTPVTPSTPEYC